MEAVHYYRELGRGQYSAEERWNDLVPLLEYPHLRPADEVLDIGCAEGLITFKIAHRVHHVRAIDNHPGRVRKAQELLNEVGLKNVSFETASIVDLDLEEWSYDVVFLLGVLHHLSPAERASALDKVLVAARRSVVLRTPLLEPIRADRVALIIDAARRHDCSFSVHGTPAHLGELVMLVRNGDERDR